MPITPLDFQKLIIRNFTLKYHCTNSLKLEVRIDKLALTGHFILFVNKQKNVWQPVQRILNQIMGAKE